MQNPIRFLIVDDEPLARTRLRQLLEGHPDVELVGEARDAAEAAALCAAAVPDALLLDIELPMSNGFDLLHALTPLPAIIFTTAHAEFALDAFEVNAVDYLLKPVTEDRFARALHRLRQKVAHPERALRPAAPRSRRIALRVPSQIVFVPATDVEWVAADGNYCRVHAEGKTVLVRELLNILERRLDPDQFVRVHRSAIVNVESIRKIIADEQGGHSVVLASGAQVRVGASYRKELERILGETL